MREKFARQLAELERRIDTQMGTAVETLRAIGEAAVEITGERVGRIAADASELRHASGCVDVDLVTIAARQAPVARDLRLVMAMIRLAHHQGLIAHQFGVISEQLLDIGPGFVGGHGKAERLGKMSGLVAWQLERAATAFAARDLALAQRIDRDDDLVDELSREVVEDALGLDAPRGQREPAVRHVLIALSLERIGDSAVDIARQAAFVVTAEVPDFIAASHPKAA